MLLCSIGASAQTIASAEIEASTEEVWENQFKLRPRNENGNYWLTYGLHSGDATKAGCFAFVAAANEGDYYIYSVDEGKWLTYSNTDNGANKITLSSVKSSYFKLTYTTCTNQQNAYADRTGYLIQAYSNGTQVSRYMNFFQGPTTNNYQTTGTVGFWQDAEGDAGSVWVLEKVVLPTEDYAIGFTNTTHTNSTRQISKIKLGDQEIDINGAGNVYQDLTKNAAFTIQAGDVVKPAIIWNGSWMHGYVYVDTNSSDKQFKVNELVSSAPMPSPERNVDLANEFSTFHIDDAGDYRMRYKVEWNHTDPLGNGGNLIANGGYVIDVMLHVVAPEYPVTYEVYFDATKLYEEVKNQPAGSAYAFSISEAEKKDYLDVAFDAGTVTGPATVRVNTSYNSNLPFQIGEKYRIKLRDAFAHYSGTEFPLTDAEGYTDDYVFTIGGDWYNGFTLFNEGAQKYLSYGTSANPNDDRHAGVSETADAGAHLALLRKDGYNFFRIHGSTNNSYTNKRSSGGTNYFSTWNTSSAFGNEGSRVFFILDSNIDVIYNVTATDENGENPIHITLAETETRGQFPVVDGKDYFSDFVITDAAPVSREKTNYTVTARYAYPMMPGHLYQIKQGSTYVQYVNDQNVSIKKTSDATNDKNLWYVLVNNNGTFKLCNAYKGLALGATKDGTDACNFKTITEQTDNFEFVKSGDNFKIFWPENSNQNLGAHGNVDGANKGLGKWGSGRNSGSVFSVEEIELATIKLTNPNPTVTSGLNGKYVGTFSTVYNVALPEGVVAYTGVVAEGGQKVNFTEIGQIVPANTGVLLYAAEASASINAKAAVATEPILPTIEEGTNIFEHTAAEAKALEAGSLILGKKDAGVAFYQISAAPNNVVARYKAYIPAAAAASISRFAFDFEEETLTGIKAVETTEGQNNIYDLQGRRVMNAQKGLYIVNGKKVVR